MSDIIPNDQYATSFIASYATLAGGYGDFPVGGSDQMIANMVARFQGLGGRLHLNSPVESVNMDGSAGSRKRRIASIVLKDGSTVCADAFIFATDPYVTFTRFLDWNRMPSKLQVRYRNRKGNPTFSGFHVAFAVDGLFEAVDGSYFWQLKKPFQCADKTITRMNIKTYHEYGPGFAPEGHDILQTHLKMGEKSYEYWSELRKKSPAEYRAEKLRVAQEALAALEEHFPAYKGKVSILDVWTPATYTRYTGAYNGAYMTFIKTGKSGGNYIPNTIKGIPNAFLASNWLMSPGGLPCALAEGYYAVWYLKRARI